MLSCIADLTCRSPNLHSCDLLCLVRQVQTLTKELEDLAAKTESEMSVLRQENATLTESVSTSMEAMKQKTELLAVQETKLK